MNLRKDIGLNDDVLASINSSVLCWLATASGDGQPNVSPKEIFIAWQSKLLIAQIASPQTLRNIRENSRVCVSFVDVFVQKGFQLKGEAKIYSRQQDGFQERHDALFSLSGPDFPFASLIEVTVDFSKPIVAPRYQLFPDTTEQEQVESAHRTYGVRGL